MCYTLHGIASDITYPNWSRTMSMMVATMKKMKDGNLGGIQKHNEREFKNHSNKDIDPERTELNYDLVNQENINYKEKINSIIDEQRISQRAIRKDAVKVDEWIISSDRDFFNDLTPQQTKEFFENAVQFFSDEFGSQNVAYASVHLDETTPHMHMGVVPMKDGKLSSKTVFNRQKLTEIQNKLPEYIKSKGFEIERGVEGSKAKHHDTEAYKKLKENVTQEQYQDLVYKLDQSEKRNIVFKDILENDFDVKKIDPKEMQARLVLNVVEKGAKAKNIEQAREWQRKLKNGLNTKIDPLRLNRALEVVQKMINSFLKIIKSAIEKTII